MRTTRLFRYPDGDIVEVTTFTKLGAYWRATREKGPVTDDVDIVRVTETFSGGST